MQNLVPDENTFPPTDSNRISDQNSGLMTAKREKWPSLWGDEINLVGFTHNGTVRSENYLERASKANIDVCVYVPVCAQYIQAQGTKKRD